MADEAHDTTDRGKYDYAVNHLLGVNGNTRNNIRRALTHGSHTTYRRLRLLLRNRDTIRQLTYIDTDNGNEVSLGGDDKDTLMALGDYFNLKQNESGRDPTRDQILPQEINEDHFASFIDVVYRPDHPIELETRSTRHASNRSADLPTPTTNSIRDWRKGIKRSPDQWPTLAKGYAFHEWWLKTQAVAKAQTVDKVLDSVYSPQTAEEQELWTSMQEYVYSILLDKVTVPVGKAFVQAESLTTNAQKAIAAIVNYYTNSTEGSERARELYTRITSSKIPLYPRKPLVDYISQFDMDVSEFIRIGEAPMYDAEKLIHMRNYVSNVEGLENIGTHADIQAGIHGVPLKPIAIMQTIRNQCSHLDHKNKAEALRLRRQTKAMQHMWADQGGDPFEIEAFQALSIQEDEDPEGNFDYYVYLSEHRLRNDRNRLRSRPNIASEEFRALSPATKAIWGRMQDHERQTIIDGAYKEKLKQLRTQDTPPPTSPKDASKPSDARSVNFAESTVVANLSERFDNATEESSDSEELDLESFVKTRAHKTELGDTWTIVEKETARAEAEVKEAPKHAKITKPVPKPTKAIKPTLPSTHVVDELKTDATSTIDSITSLKKMTKEEAKDVDVFDMRSLLNQSSDHTAHKTQRYLERKQEDQKEKEEKKKSESQRETPPPQKKTSPLRTLINSMTFRKGSDTGSQTADKSDHGRQVNMTVCHLTPCRPASQGHGLEPQETNSIIDRGANGGVAGRDLRLISYAEPGRTVSTNGIDGHRIGDLPLGTFGAVCHTRKGKVILIFHQYAHLPDGDTIHSPIQLEDNGIVVDDRPHSLGGQQCLRTRDGNEMSLKFQNGLAKLPLRRFTDEELLTLPQIHMTKNRPWDPTTYDNDSDSVPPLLPSTHAQAMELDCYNGDTRWQDAESRELAHLARLNPTIFEQFDINEPAPFELHYTIRADGTYKCRLVSFDHVHYTDVRLLASGHFPAPDGPTLWPSFFADLSPEDRSILSEYGYVPPAHTRSRSPTTVINARINGTSSVRTDNLPH